MRLLQSPWMAGLLGGLLYLGTTLALFKPHGTLHGTSAAALKHFVNNEVSWRFHNPEFDQWVSELRQEKDALALREQQLNELQTRIEVERLELTTVTQQVAQLQADFDRNVIRFKSQEAENVKRQAKLLNAMTPETAAAMLAEMSDDEVVRLLFVMKNDQVSTLLETMSKAGKAETKRATLLTERLRLVLPAAADGSKTNAAL